MARARRVSGPNSRAARKDTPRSRAEGVRGSPLEVHPLTPARWADLEMIFGARGCAVARGCWCMAYRISGSEPPPPPGQTLSQQRRAALKNLVEDGGVPGLIGYRDGKPVGWVSLGPREDYARLRRSPVMKPVDPVPVWSLVCFVVPAEHRRQGVARGMLAAAIEHATRCGATMLEAYPVDRKGHCPDEAIWFGTKSMFDAAGFKEVARRKAGRPVMRRRLG